MSKINEIIDSLNDENASEVMEQIKIEADAMGKKNGQLYSRAKKAEGFEQNKETKEWTKKEVEAKKPDSKKTNKGELDYGQKAFLASNGVKGADEIKLVTDYIENTGKSLEDVLESKHFLAEVKDLRDAKAVNDALGGDTGKRGGGATRDKVEYWIAKGELPPKDQPQLRKDYVNAKLKKSKEDGIFYNS